MVKTIHRYEYKIKKEAKNQFEKDFFKLIIQFLEKQWKMLEITGILN